MLIFVRMMMEALIDLVMPRTCLVCGRQLGQQERHLCIWCAADLPKTYYWERVHNPMADEFNAVLEQSRKEGEPMEYAQAAALLLYHHENPYKKIPQALKYQANLGAGRYFAAILGRAMAAQEHWRGVDAVIPIPLHWRRQWKRGYNQAEVIAGQLARELGARLYPRALGRIRHTRSQTSLDAKDRLKNMEGVFTLRRAPPGARHILLVDDTFTTGATLAAAYNAIRSALGHSVKISVATLAAVQD